jgi:catechol 2,3-dioxygenase-like lactoylglutathione lyase family enzyme
MKIKHVMVFVKDMEEAIGFFTQKLGFSAADVVVFDTRNNQVPIRINNADQYLNLVVDKEKAGFKTRIILNTEDCLKDYHHLKTQGVDFKNQPQYLSAGLYAEFNDNYGNEFVLLEERNYNEL